MARIQVMPLPTLRVGDYTTTPFVLIIDQLDDMTAEGIDRLNIAATAIIGQTGASALWVMADGDLDVAQPLDLDDETRQRVMDQLHQAPDDQHSSLIQPDMSVQGWGDGPQNPVM